MYIFTVKCFVTKSKRKICKSDSHTSHINFWAGSYSVKSPAETTEARAKAIIDRNIIYLSAM